MKSTNLTRSRVLIVDNSIEMLTLMSNLLQPYGFHTLATSSPDDALLQASTFQPHAIYLSLHYAECDGWELAAKIRRVQGMDKTVLVGLIDRACGWSSNDGIGSHGFDYYLPKPPRMRDIVEAFTTDRRELH